MGCSSSSITKVCMAIGTIAPTYGIHPSVEEGYGARKLLDNFGLSVSACMTRIHVRHQRNSSLCPPACVTLPRPLAMTATAREGPTPANDDARGTLGLVVIHVFVCSRSFFQWASSPATYAHSATSARAPRPVSSTPPSTTPTPPPGRPGPPLRLAALWRAQRPGSGARLVDGFSVFFFRSNFFGIRSRVPSDFLDAWSWDCWLARTIV